MDELLHGHINKESIGALVTGVGDVASLIPGATVGWKAATGGARAAAEGGSTLASISRLASEASNAPGLVTKGLAKVPGVKQLGEASTVVDSLLKAGRERGLGEPVINGLDRLNLFWRTYGVGSHAQHDVKQATS
jgi:hypothetical protein